MALRNAHQVAVPCDEVVDDCRTTIMIKDEVEKSKCIHEGWYAARHEFSIRKDANCFGRQLIITH
jgi:hypothetical protein